MRYVSIARIIARILLETPVRIHPSLRHGFVKKGGSTPHRATGHILDVLFSFQPTAVGNGFVKMCLLIECQAVRMFINLLVKCFFLLTPDTPPQPYASTAAANGKALTPRG